jgi:hypothetical protein
MKEIRKNRLLAISSSLLKSVALRGLLLTMFLPLTAMAYEVTVADVNGNELTYSYDSADGPATFTRIKTYSADAAKAGHIVIADRVTDSDDNSHDVLYISGNVYNRGDIVSIVFGSNIIATGGADGTSSDAFYNCKKLESVTLNSKLQILGQYTFQACSNLTSINLGEATSLTEIRKQCFENCDRLRSLVLPKSVTTLGDAVFDNCDSLRTFTFADGSALTAIPYNTFAGCGSLQKITIPDGVKTIGQGAFYYDQSLTEITFGTGLTEFANDYYMFYNCPLTKMVLPGANFPLKREYALADGIVLYVHPDLFDTYRNSDYTKNCRVIPIGQQTVFAVTTDAGGQLGGKIEAQGDPNNVLELTVTGPIDGTDIDYLHGYLPNLKVLNLTDARIVAGGDSYHQWEVSANGTATQNTYYGPWNTQDDVVGHAMFYNMPSLTSISLPKGTTKIGEYALAQDRNTNYRLAHVDIPASVTTIAKYAFHYTGITEVTVPSGVTRIEENTFANCRKMQRAVLPDAVTFIGNSAFSECQELQDVNIPANVETIDQYAFYNNKVRTTPIVLPATLKTIGYRAFMYNSKVESITFSEGLETIRGYAFSNCNAVKALVLPESLTKLENNAFEGCDSLTEFRFPANIKQVPGGILYHCDKLQKVVLAEGTTSIDNYAFQYCTKLSEMNLTEQTSLTKTGIYCFANTGFTTVTLPNSITSMDYSAFRSCEQLTSINVPTQLTTVPYDFVAYCPNLTSVQMHDGIRVIGHYAFLDCKSLTNIDLNDQITDIEYEAFNRCESLELNKLPEALVNIGSSAFRDNQKMTGKLVVPTSVKKIDSEAFRETNISAVELPEGITSWGTALFYNCTSLTSVQLPKDIKRITNSMFQYCTALEQIELPDSLKEIGNSAFDRSGLTTITLPDSLVKLESYAFSNTQLRSFTVPDGIRGDQPGSYVAAGCKRLKEASLGRNQDYTTITSFTFFDSCDSLKLLRVYAGMPPKCNSWYLRYRQNCVLEVPEDAVDLYKETDIWKEFKEIRGFESGDVLNDLDFAVLKNLYRTLDGKNWKQPWDLTNNHRSMGKWYGVLTVGDYITEIDLSGQGLQGELSDSLFLLSRIEVLNLSDNHIKADLTTLLAKRAANTTLTQLNMMGNELSGDIYPFASKLPNLTKLDLSYNQLTEVSQPMSREKLDNGNFYRGFQFVDYHTKQVVEGAPVIDITPGIPATIESNTLQTYRHEYGDYNFTFSDLYRHYLDKNDSWTTSDWELSKNNEGLWDLYSGWYNRALRAPKGVPVIYTHGQPWYSHLTYIIRFDWKDGDTNADQTVDVTDLQSIIYYALNDSKADEQMFNFTAADVNSDEKINVSDIVGSVDYILNYVETAHAQVPYYYNRAPASQQNILSIDGNNIVLTHADAVAALQLTITGVALGQLRVSEALKSQFSVALREVDGGVRMVVYSADGQALTPGIHQLLTDLPAGTEVTDVRLSDAQARHLDIANEGGLTGIHSIMSEQLIDSEAPVFDLNGRRLGAWDTLPEGVYVIRMNGKQYKVKK